MISGIFIDNTPYIHLTLIHKDPISEWFILDTGFTGDIHISYDFGKKLGITQTTKINFSMANGINEYFPSTSVKALIEGVTQNMEVIISNGKALVGIGFLSKFGYKAIVDCKFKTLDLIKV